MEVFFEVVRFVDFEAIGLVRKEDLRGEGGGDHGFFGGGEEGDIAFGVGVVAGEFDVRVF